jgi:DNA-binding transcriptional regulator YiaG
MDASQLAGLLTVIITVSGVAAAILVLSKSRGTKERVELFRATNQELRESYTWLTQEKERQESDFNLKLLAQDEQCKKEIAELRGQVQLMVSDFAQQLAVAIAHETAAELRRQGHK